MSYTAGGHQGAVEVFWLHSVELSYQRSLHTVVGVDHKTVDILNSGQLL